MAQAPPNYASPPLILPFNGVAPTCHESAWIAPGARIIGNVTLGEEASIWYNAVVRGDTDPIHIGDRSNVQDGTVIHVDWNAPTYIGSDVTIGHSAIIHGCTIGDRSLIGMGAIILNHAQIGEDSLIAAGALITERKIIPPRSLVMGSPGRIVRTLTDDEVASILASAHHYVESAIQHRDALSAS